MDWKEVLASHLSSAHLNHQEDVYVKHMQELLLQVDEHFGKYGHLQDASYASTVYKMPQERAIGYMAGWIDGNISASSRKNSTDNEIEKQNE